MERAETLTIEQIGQFLAASEEVRLKASLSGPATKPPNRLGLRCRKQLNNCFHPEDERHKGFPLHIAHLLESVPAVEDKVNLRCAKIVLVKRQA
jgi:hypothetical protein